MSVDAAVLSIACRHFGTAWHHYLYKHCHRLGKCFKLPPVCTVETSRVLCRLQAFKLGKLHAGDLCKICALQKRNCNCGVLEKRCACVSFVTFFVRSTHCVRTVQSLQWPQFWN